MLTRQEQGGETEATWAERVFQELDRIESPLLPGLNVTVAELMGNI